MSEDARFWLFHAPNMLLAAALYTLIGRYILSLVFRKESDLVIWRVFRQLTDPLLRAVRAATPRVVPDGLVMVFAIVWMLILRIIWLLTAALGGFLPERGGSLIMQDMDQREALLKQDGYMIGIAMLSLLNGMDFSPYFEPGLVLVRPMLFGFYITSPLIIFYITSLLLAVSTLVIAGVPAALFERMTGRRTSDAVSMAIWMGCTALLSLPSLLKLLGFA